VRLGLPCYAEHAERFLADEEVATNAKHSYIHYQPLGPILALYPAFGANLVLLSLAVFVVYGRLVFLTD